MTVINRWIDKLDKLLIYISAATLIILMLLVCVDVFLRSIFNNPIIGVMEFTGEYLMVIIVYFAVSYAQKDKYHVNVDYFQDKFSPVIKKITILLSNLISIVLFLFIGYHNYLKSLEYFEQDIKSVGLLNYPLAPALMIIALGTVLLSIRLIIESIQILRKTENGS